MTLASRCFAGRRVLPFVGLLLAATVAHAETTVTDAWARGTVPNQPASGAFMKITSAEGGKLVSASSPVAGLVEVHEMKMENNVMKMAPVAGGIPLPAGQAVELKPGGYHVMLMQLKQQLKAGDTVPVTLTIEHSGGGTETVEVEAPVKALGTDAGHMNHDMKDMKH